MTRTARMSTSSTSDSGYRRRPYWPSGRQVMAESYGVRTEMESISDQEYTNKRFMVWFRRKSALTPSGREAEEADIRRRIVGVLSDKFLKDTVDKLQVFSDREWAGPYYLFRLRSGPDVTGEQFAVIVEFGAVTKENVIVQQRFYEEPEIVRMTLRQWYDAKCRKRFRRLPWPWFWFTYEKVRGWHMRFMGYEQ